MSASAQSIDHAKRLFDAGRFAEAKSELMGPQRANDRDATTVYYLRRVALMENDGDEAIAHFERAVELESPPAGPRTRRASTIVRRRSAIRYRTA